MRPITSTGRSIVALCVLTLIPCWAIAQEEQQPRNRDRLTLATYEVGDLIVHVPDYSLTGEGAPSPAPGAGAFGAPGFGGEGGYMGMGGFGPGMGGGVSGHGQQITIDSLRNAIVSVVAPESWALSQEGGQGRIEVVGTALVVSQADEAHQAISQLLEQLRDGSATRRTISIDARWLMLNSDDLDRLITRTDKGERNVNREVLDELTRRPDSLRGATNCFSGQAVYLISGTRRNVVSSYIPVVGSVDPPHADSMMAADEPDAGLVFIQMAGRGGEGSGRMMGEGGFGGRGVGYQPVIERPNFGVTMQIRPTLSTRGKDAVIDLKSTVTFPAHEPQAEDPAMAPGMPTVDRLSIQTQELATTLRVALGEPTLIGGMTYMAPREGEASTPAPQEAPAAPGEQRQLYLVIELR